MTTNRRSFVEAGLLGGMVAALPAGASAAISFDGKDDVAIAWLVLASGDLRVTQTTRGDLASELARIAPSEVLLADDSRAPAPETDVRLQRLPPWHFDAERGARLLRELLNVATLAAFGIEDEPLMLAAAGALLAYAQDTQQAPLAHVTRITVEHEREFVALDAVSRRNLELTDSLRGDGTDAVSPARWQCHGDGQPQAAALAAPPAARGGDRPRAAGYSSVR